MSACGCKVMLQMNSEVRMITFVGKEGCNAGSGTQSIVVNKLSQWKEFGPIVLLVVAIDSEVLFQSLVCSFGLPITFRMIPGCEVKFHVKCSSKGSEEMGHKLCSSIRSDVARDTMLGEECVERTIAQVEVM